MLPQLFQLLKLELLQFLELFTAAIDAAFSIYPSAARAIAVGNPFSVAKAISASKASRAVRAISAPRAL